MAAGHALGQKLPSFIYGKANKAKMLQKYETSSLPPKKCWMDSDLFEEQAGDNKFEGQNRNVLMILNNCYAHPEIGSLKAMKLCFLPPNTTSISQPMNQGVIRSLKPLPE